MLSAGASKPCGKATGWQRWSKEEKYVWKRRRSYVVYLMERRVDDVVMWDKCEGRVRTMGLLAAD
jgi:hypothetical protein